MERVDLTYSGVLKARKNVFEKENILVDYTVEGDTGKVTTTSFLLKEDPLLMITFNYQDLKKMIEGEEE